MRQQTAAMRSGDMPDRSGGFLEKGIVEIKKAPFGALLTLYGGADVRSVNVL